MFFPLRACVAALVLSSATLPANATCTGETLDGRLTGAEQAELSAAVAATPFAEGLIWQATKGDHVITLVGTFHLADPRHEVLMAKVAPLLARTDRLLVEITPEGEAELQRHLAANPDLILLPDNGSLIQEVPPEVWAPIAQAASERQMPPFMAARMQPWYLTMSLSIPTCAMPDLLAGERGLDFDIMSAAKAAGIPIDPVEDWHAALSILRQGSFDEQVEMLQIAVADPDMQAQAMNSMIEDYFAGHIARIWELNRISMRWTPGLSQDEADVFFDSFSAGLLTDRNNAWMPVILQAAEKEDRLMVAVGAAHLPGEVGLLNQLATKGWTISAVN